MTGPFLIVGLGNPGAEYERTRHNVGFWAIDALQSQLKADSYRDKFGGAWVKSRASCEDVFLLKPQTFMNRSGEPTQQLVQFYKVAGENVIVIHDELDFEPGIVRLKLGGGAGGHNGLRSLVSCIGADFVRVRLGIGKAKPGQDGAGYVLGVPPLLELKTLQDAALRAAHAALLVVDRGIKAAMNQVNTKSR